MRLSSLPQVLATAACLLAAATLVHAQPMQGDAISLQIDGTSAAPQRILVIPVVDASFAYNAGARQIETAFPGVRNTIVTDYGTMGSFWTESSYGNVNLTSEIPNCFYQISSQFPTAGEAPFQRAFVKGRSVLFVTGVSFSSITVDYISDPAEGTKTVTLTSDPSVVFTDGDDVAAHLNAALGPAAAELEILAVGPTSILGGTGSASLSGSLLFQIVESRTFAGSSVAVNVAASDAESRATLGLGSPTFTYNQSTGRAIVTSDGASVPGRYAPGSISFQFKTADESAFDFFTWDLVFGSCSGASCPVYRTLTELDALIAPGPTETFGEVRETATGRHEWVFEMALNPANLYTQFTVSGTDMLDDLGLSFMEEQDGNGRQDINRDSRVLTKEALQAFLNTELASNAACLSSELADRTIPVPGSATYDADVAATKAAIDSYLGGFAAIHTFLLSNGDIIRDNASYTNLATTLSSSGGGNMSYQVNTPVAAMEIFSGTETIAHETGHNIGFPDLYDNSNDETPEPSEYHEDLTFPGDWDVMADHSDYPHPGSFIKQSFHGWLESPESNHGDVITVVPGQDITFVLTPLEHSRTTYDNNLSVAEPVAKMLVLPFGDDLGTNSHVPTHFIAIENRQTGAAFSQDLPFMGGLYVSDNISDFNLNGRFIKPVSRNYSHTLTDQTTRPDTNGRPVAVNTTLDTALTFPSFPGVTVQNVGLVAGPNPTDPPSLLVRVNYQVTQTMDLKIEPWRAPEEYATPSIWFEPATGPTPPVNPTVPSIVGNVNAPVFSAGYDPMANGGKPLNWVHIFVENPGQYDVQNVKLKVSLNSPGGAGDPADWETLEITAGKSIPAGGSTVFSVPWSPTEEIAADGHTCIAAEVFEWEVAGLGQVSDINPFNNVSQENIHSMVMVSGSPWHDVPFQFEVHNSYDREVKVQVEPHGLLPGYAVTLDTSTAQLAGRTSRIFSGVLHWDSERIPTPPNQNPDDPFWQACDGVVIPEPEPVPEPEPIVVARMFPGDVVEDDFGEQVLLAGAPPELPAYCENTWGLTAFAAIGDFRVPLGGVSFHTEAMPTATLTTGATVGTNGDITATCGISPAFPGQDVRVIVKYPSGRHDIIDIVTAADGSCTLTFTPKERGPIVISTELPRGGRPFAPTTPVEVPVDACLPASGGATPGGGGGTPGASLSAQLVPIANWAEGYCVAVRVTNNTSSPINGWSVAVNTNQSTTYTTWNGSFSGTSGVINVQPGFSWNQTLAPGASNDSVGFCANRAVSGSGTLPLVVSTTP